MDPASRDITKSRAVYVNGSWKLAPIETLITNDTTSSMSLVGQNAHSNRTTQQSRFETIENIAKIKQIDRNPTEPSPGNFTSDLHM